MEKEIEIVGMEAGKVTQIKINDVVYDLIKHESVTKIEEIIETTEKSEKPKKPIKPNRFERGSRYQRGNRNVF